MKMALKDPESSGYNPVTRASECQFESLETTNLTNSGNLLIRIEKLTNPEMDFQELRDLMGGVNRVSNIGEDAFYSANQLVILQGDYKVTVAVAWFGDRAGEKLEVAQAIGHMILSKL